jgi:hypothetical protein
MCYIILYICMELKIKNYDNLTQQKEDKKSRYNKRLF